MCGFGYRPDTQTPIEETMRAMNYVIDKGGHFIGGQNLANRSLIDDMLRKFNGLKPIVDELGIPLAQLAIVWCAANPNVSSVITAATKESQGQTS
ncbi:hypothetical protein GOBAR_DD04779 [Gossypium barbadense]|nr:hypothetical protein GOBAR_DD04779 [Gossypium barbadense]